MRTRRREIEIFSMSALDLFASGMGAFIILAVVAMPFFPKTGDSPAQSEELKALLAEATERTRELEQALAEATETSRQLEEALSKAKLGDLDLVICLDVTASMTAQIDGLKREIGGLARILDSLAPSVGVGVVAFGDRMWSQPVRAHDIVETTNLRSLMAFINSLTPNMNDPRAGLNTDGPEALATALERAVASDWRPPSSRKFIVVITDNAAYPERRAAATQLAQSFASQAGRYVSTVRANYTVDPGDRQAADRFLRQLAAAGRGQFVDAAGGESMIGSLLLAILDI